MISRPDPPEASFPLAWRAAVSSTEQAGADNGSHQCRRYRFKSIRDELS
jgi:hypothetical protein